MKPDATLNREVISAIVALPERIRPEVERAWEKFLDHAEVSSLAGRIGETTRVWAASPFVAGLSCADPNILLQLLERGGLDRPYSENEMKAQIEQALLGIESEDSLMRALRRIRNTQMLRIAWRDLAGAAPLQETLLDLSLLAEACVSQALDWCYAALCNRFGVPRNREGEAQGMVVLGMGKLGGYELNFSSDIDLVFTYPEEGATDGARGVANSQFFIRLGQRLIKVLNDTTVDGFVFRVDLRLRPFGESGPLVVSFNAMEDYYEQHGRDWERYAMIKARVIAGDQKAGKQLLTQLRPFVYRRYLDYGAFEALRNMKGLINIEIRRRKLDDNVKLGAGGIREIEFIGQAFQLIRGGRDADLQERRIQVVLSLLEKKGLLPKYAVKKLLKAYDFLRRTENHLQMTADQQTHKLPSEPVQRERLAFSMGYETWPEFKADLDSMRQQVHDLFLGISAIPQFDNLHDLGKKDNSTPLVRLWNGILDEKSAISLLAKVGYQKPQQAFNALKQLRMGHVYHLKNAIGRERVDRLMPLLIAAVGQSADPDTVLSRLLPLIEAIVRRSVYIALLAEYPMALSQLVQLSAASPWISEYLRSHPILLDELLDPRSLYAPLDKAALEEDLRIELDHIDEDDLETLMDRVRQFKQANVLRVAASDVMDFLPLMKVSDQLTWIAEAILEQVVKICMRVMVAKHGKPQCIVDNEVYHPGFAIIAYGKLGGIELGYGSDLDLVFLHDSRGQAQYTDGNKSVNNPVFYARLGQRIIHFLTTFTPAGELYEVDARLRPSGASGLLVSSIQAFEEYQLEQAWTWEHQALVRARMVAGDLSVAERFSRIRHRVLSRQRDMDQLRVEVCNMRQRMLDSRSGVSDGHFNLKRDPGGIADIEFMVQFSVLAYAHKYPSLIEYTDNIRQLEGLEHCRLISADDAQFLRDSYREFRDKIHALSLQGEAVVVDATQFLDQRSRIRQMWHNLMEN